MTGLTLSFFLYLFETSCTVTDTCYGIFTVIYSTVKITVNCRQAGIQLEIYLVLLRADKFYLVAKGGMLCYHEYIFKNMKISGLFNTRSASLKYGNLWAVSRELYL